MTREEILNSNTLKKRFCKDTNLPINVFQNPYFIQRLATLGPFFNGTLEKFDTFVNSLQYFRSEQDYLEYYNSIKETVINDIKSRPGYQKLQDCTFDYDSSNHTCRIGDIIFRAEPWSASIRKNLYSETNSGKRFISIDMKKANFTAMRAFDPLIFRNHARWETYLSEFTDLPSIISSKYIRQVIFGACNPKRQITLEQWLMLNALYVLYNNYYQPYDFSAISLFSLTGDEIILNDTGISLSFIRQTLKDHAVIGNSLHVERFLLEKIPGTDAYIRTQDDGTVTFKCLDSETCHQILKHYQNQPVTDDDLVFYHNGQLARFLEPVPNPWA